MPPDPLAIAQGYNLAQQTQNVLGGAPVAPVQMAPQPEITRLDNPAPSPLPPPRDPSKMRIVQVPEGVTDTLVNVAAPPIGAARGLVDVGNQATNREFQEGVKGALKKAHPYLDRAVALGRALVPGGGGVVSRAIGDALKPGEAQAATLPPGTAPPGEIQRLTPPGAPTAPFTPGSGSIFGGAGQGGPVNVGAADIDKVAPGRQAALMASFGGQQDALKRVADAEEGVGQANSDAALSKAGAQQTVASEQKSQGEDALQRAQARAEEERGKQGAISAESRKRDEFSARVMRDFKEDPQRWYRTQGTAQKVGYGLSLALGTAGSSFLGQENQVLNMIHRSVDEDIAAQRQDYEHARHRYADMGDRIGDMKNLYAMGRQTGLDEEGATQYAKGLLLDGVKQQADAIATSTGSAQAIANANLLKSKIGVTGAEVGTEASKADIAMHQYVPAHTVQTGAGVDINKVIKRGQEIRDKAASEGITMPIEEAQRQAYREYTGKDLGNGPQMSYAKPPAGAKDEKAQEAEKQQLSSDLAQVDRFGKNIGHISPSLVQGTSATDRGKRRQEQEEYNAFVLRTVAENYKRSTGNVEPKNPDLIKELAQPFMVDTHNGTAWEPEAVTAQKIAALKRAIEQSNVGLTKKDPNAAAPFPFTPVK